MNCQCVSKFPRIKNFDSLSGFSITVQSLKNLQTLGEFSLFFKYEILTFISSYSGETCYSNYHGS